MTTKAGAIILNKENSILLLFRSREADWSFPKGHMDEGEDSAKTMLREIKEETGLEISILCSLPSLEYFNNKEGKICLAMFLARSDAGSVLKPEFEGDRLEWFNIEEVEDRLTYDNLKEYYRSALPLIQNSLKDAQGAK